MLASKDSLAPETENETAQLSGSEITPWWHLWQKNQEWREKLQKKATYKALDIPEENDVNINVDKSQNGLSSLATVGLAAGSALLGGGIPTALMLGSGLLNSASNNSSIKESTTTTTVAPSNPSDGAVLEFYVRDQDGNYRPTTVPRMEQSPIK